MLFIPKSGTWMLGCLGAVFLRRRMWLLSGAALTGPRCLINTRPRAPIVGANQRRGREPKPLGG